MKKLLFIITFFILVFISFENIPDIKTYIANKISSTTFKQNTPKLQNEKSIIQAYDNATCLKIIYT